MDLTSPKIKNSDKLDLCRKYFYIGIAFLPFLWGVNFIWFFKEAFVRPAYEEQAKLKKYVVWSGIGWFVWTVVFITWVIVFVQYRASWGEVGDSISFMIPTGVP